MRAAADAGSNDMFERRPVAAEKPFHATNARRPLPRAYQWANGSGYVTPSSKLVAESPRRRNAARSGRDPPLMYQAARTVFIGPCDPLLARTNLGHRFRGRKLRSLSTTVPMGISAAPREAHKKLADAGERVSAAEPDTGGAGPRISAFPVQAGDGVFAGPMKLVPRPP